MSHEWSLKELYESYDSPAYQADFEALRDGYKQLNELELVDELTTIKKIIELIEQIGNLSRKLSSYSHLQLSTDTTHEPSLTAVGKLRKLISENAKVTARINKFLGNSQTDISQDDHLSAYSFYFDELRQEASHLLSEEVEEVIATMDLSAGQAWNQLHSFLTSTVEGTFDGKAVTLSDIRNLAYSDDADVRKHAYETELEMYQTVKEPVAFALNNIKSQYTDIARLRGYDSAIDITLEESRMSKATLDALIGAIEDALPAFRRYLKHKATLLGHKNGLPFYDLFAPIGQTTSRKFTVEESRDYLVSIFSKFSPDLAELTQEIYDNNHVDMFPRKGKVGGAFCMNLPFLKQSRILMNFDGKLRNVVTMAHELGHAYHGLHIEDHLVLNRSYTMPVAETASTFNENLVMNTVIAEASDAEKISLIESSLQDATQIIVDIYSRYLFESAVFEQRQDKFLFSKDLEALMLEAQEKAYGDGLDSDVKHPYMWLCKGHYYYPQLSFYNFPYAFGGLFSKGLYALYTQEPEGFVEKYQAMLRATTVSSVEDTAKQMGIDVTKKEFWATALAEYAKEIDAFIELTK
ncbi:M3 family oligoendopeptidase [Tuanshanicoccus lijuaniae]|uniref:M3 family oligoendopeptidase n=1 Tax=Aerococcaceae bacterium zg-1292 TaxID=2774330 RepID=UPI001BD90B2C|nr:M3 family oligoendopeptidase [Aerococcaceae bacterium zg-A91]MBS4457673.1 M3 family oligoendopeptidase [Aerococcaceae bacterium zg-BR33]